MTEKIWSYYLQRLKIIMDKK